MENYDQLECISTGSFGKVFKIRRKSDGKLLVWKELCYGKMSEKEKQQLVAEVNILRELRHPHIVKYYDRIIDKPNQKICIVMEYCEGGDMATFLKRLKREKETLPEETIWKIFMQLVMALHEIHRRKEGKILHRDIKPANIFLDSQNSIKLGDFGLSKMLSGETSYAYTNVGTPYYMSPEQISESKYNEKSDIWSAGCFLYELCTLNPPFEAPHHYGLAVRIKKASIEPIPSQYSDELKRVITWILSKKHEERPTVDDLLNIPCISRKVREKRLKENKALLKKREDDIKQREETLVAQESNLKQKESDLKIKEKLLLEQEKKLKDLEDNFKNKENSSLVGNYMRTGERLATVGNTFELNFKERKPNISKTVNLSTKYYGVNNTSNFSTTFERNTSMVDNNRTYYSSVDKDNTVDISSTKISKYPSFKEDDTSPEAAGNNEISNILKHIDRIRVESSDEEDGEFGNQDKTETSAFMRQNGTKMY